jgi:hypothetical protein
VQYTVHIQNLVIPAHAGTHFDRKTMSFSTMFTGGRFIVTRC